MVPREVQRRHQEEPLPDWYAIQRCLLLNSLLLLLQMRDLMHFHTQAPTAVGVPTLPFPSTKTSSTSLVSYPWHSNPLP